MVPGRGMNAASFSLDVEFVGFVILKYLTTAPETSQVYLSNISKYK